MTKATILGVLASGRGSNLQSIIEAIQSGRLLAKIGVVISDKPEANALKRVAGLGIATVCVDRKKYATALEFEEAIVAELVSHQVDLVVLAGFMRILSPYFVNAFRQRIMNIHPSLLPSFPGKDAQEQAIRYGAKVSGCTVHFVDEGMDSGPIILQQAVPVLDHDTPAMLAERILHEEHKLYPQAIRLFTDSRLQVEGRNVRILDKERQEDENEYKTGIN